MGRWWNNEPEIKPATVIAPEPKPKFEPKPLLFSRYFFAEFQDEDPQPWVIYRLINVANNVPAGADGYHAIFFVDTETNAAALMKALDAALDSAKPTEAA